MKSTPRSADWEGCIEVLRPVLLLGPRSYLDDVRARLDADGIATAIIRRDTATIFDWIVRSLARQGIGNHAAEVFRVRNGSPTFAEIAELMGANVRCPRLHCYWGFEGCSYRRSTGSCGTPHHRIGCPVTLIPARKGSLAEAAIGLWLFVRDVCGGDLVGWIDRRLVSADSVGAHRLTRMRAAILEPLIEIPGTGQKIWSMIMAELLLGADPRRLTWIEVGASFVAVDTLVHAFLHRTGMLHRLDASHPYGPACYGAEGCLAVLEGIASHIDAREFNPAFPTLFPRWVQFAIWWFCAADGWAVCNGSRIDEGVGCEQRFCVAYGRCDKRPTLT